MISIHAPLAGCDRYRQLFAKHLFRISIHAPLAGCDRRGADRRAKRHISIHAPLAGCDYGACDRAVRDDGFQSTHPLRGATRWPRYVLVRGRFQSTHPLRGATFTTGSPRRLAENFNPRTPCGVRLRDVPDFQHPDGNFNPRTPCGVRPGSMGFTSLSYQFQSTHPLRGATYLSAWACS